jgi:hypothetical protein
MIFIGIFSSRKLNTSSMHFSDSRKRKHINNWCLETSGRGRSIIKH